MIHTNVTALVPVHTTGDYGTEIPVGEMLKKIAKGDAVDLYAVAVEYKDEWNSKHLHLLKDGPFYYRTGDDFKVKFGISMKLPIGYHAKLFPRSSTFKNFGLIQTNSVGLIDNHYHGFNDEWAVQFYAVRNGSISILDRTNQFLIEKTQVPEITFVHYEDDPEGIFGDDRGGFGSTGKNKEIK